ncbi:MAG: hypothetical protein NT022_13225 [Deltaproteobacteria bacterium]|nr:hypothetical protein [Deltaproteobacteria bacterium]
MYTAFGICLLNLLLFTFFLNSFYGITKTDAEKDNILFPVKIKGRFGNIDEAGSTKTPPRFDEAGLFLGDVDRVQSNGKTSYINKSGKSIWESPDGSNVPTNKEDNG